MTPEAMHKLVQLSYQAYEKGERSFLDDLLHDEVQWIMHSPPEALPVPNRISGKANVMAALRKIDETVEIIRNDLQVIVAEGDWAAMIFDRTVRQRSTGRVLRYKTAAFQRYCNGRLIEFQGFADSMDLLQQVIGRELDLPQAYPGAKQT